MKRVLALLLLLKIKNFSVAFNGVSEFFRIISKLVSA